MKLPISGYARLLVAALSAGLVTACSDNSSNAQPVVPPVTDTTYSADIVWTEYGIPHVTATDWGSLGYGSGYVAAQANYCVIMRAIVDARGESARYFGAEGNLDMDLVMKLVNDDAAVQRMYDALPPFMQQNLAGYAAGLNRYLDETGVANLAEGEEGCRSAPWVRAVDTSDIVRRVHKQILRASSDPLAKYTVAASPDQAVSLGLPVGVSPRQQLLASVDSDRIRAAIPMPTGEQIGSNAYAVGAEGSQTNSGILFGNPHFPWQGYERFFMFHLTLPGEYDVMGSALLGLPAPVIGFNQNLAWSHTVSTGKRFTFYELELNPENDMQYIYDGQIRDIETRTVSAEVLQPNDSVATVEHTFYLSHFGPIVDLGVVSPLLAGWPNAVGTLLTYRDANLENLRGLEQWVRMGQAADLGEFETALRSIGIPWVNTIAADRYGDALYSDISVVPHVSVAKYNSCIRGLLQNLLTDAGFVTMDGSDSACEWGSDANTPAGIFGYDSLPKLDTRQYGANANDSYWLANPRHLLEGFSPIIGKEGVAQSIRTRHTFDQAEQRLAGTDGLGAPGFNIDNIRQLHYRATNYAAVLIVQDVVEICSGVTDWSAYSDNAATVAQACSVLANWDGSHRVDSVGGHVFYEFWRAVSGTANLWAVPFDAADPVHTPRDLNITDSVVVEAVKQALADGVDRLVTAGIPMDRPWGEVQFDEKNGVRYPIHGGSGSMMFSVITSSLVDGEGYSAIGHGNSYIQAVTWDESDCPDAYAILTYSQSTDPGSDNYADSTGLYADGGWIDMPFCEAARDAQEVRRATITE
ncbi:MAG: penicillin acylase family protein [Pseudomonadales bacterium]|nr:penicillin acylase family protein [Pseudomonadales bacterium]